MEYISSVHHGVKVRAGENQNVTAQREKVKKGRKEERNREIKKIKQ